jgi:hypothetical protein
VSLFCLAEPQALCENSPKIGVVGTTLSMMSEIQAYAMCRKMGNLASGYDSECAAACVVIVYLTVFSTLGQLRMRIFIGMVFFEISVD